MKFFYISVILLTALFFLSCNGNEILVEKQCSEPPDLSAYDVRLELRTDTTIETRFNINRTGYFLIENVPVKNSSYVKNVNISGFVCKDYSSEIFVDFNDSLTNSRLKATLHQDSPIYIRGEVWYCDNENALCNYLEIGSVIAVISDRFEGAFNTPLISGTFDAYLLN